jgi:predicted alpha/beta-hydrolase family hydrolase
MTSQAQAASPLGRVRGLIFLGFPLHPPEQPSDARGEHLSRVGIPLLFIQGARDEFAEAALLNPLIERLGSRATLCVLPGADHSFRVPVRATLTQGQINGLMLDVLTAWVDASIV